ncbi:MAG: putative Ig domain-containing protein, partial [Bacteroidota bacterium]|nr:putative Ig domain-containing protein [Bacteroidota bacterium]
TDGPAADTQTFVIVVGNINDAPTFETMPDTVATEDVLYSSAVTGADLDVDDSLRYSATEIPPWLTFNDTTGVLSGTPGNDEVGFHDVTLTINDGTVTVDSAFQIRVANVNDAPTFATMPDTVATEDVLYASAITGADIDVGDSLIYRATVIPGWLTFNDTTGILSGTPGNGDVGFHDVTLTINDGTVTLDSAFQIRVANVNDAPTFETMPDTVALEDTPYSSAVTGADVDVGDSLIYSAPVLPAWLTFNDTTGVLSGTAGDTLLGDHNVTLRLFDGTVNVDSAFVITLLNTNDPPTFTSIPDTVALQGDLYSYTPTAEDIDGDSLIFSAPVLPVWLSFDSVTHVLSGTPGNDHVGDNSVSLMISDTVVDVVQSFIIVVENINDPPTFTSTPITEARPGVAYNYTVIAEDIDGDDLTYAALVLPGWLTFNSTTQLLSATPSDTDEGDQHVTIRVTDGLLYADQTFVISVSYANHAPNFISDPATTVVVGESYVYTINAYDIDGDDLTYSAPLLPDWLTFYPATNVISGIPRTEDLGSHDVTVRVSDGTVSADQSFPITVRNENVAPAFTSTPETSVIENQLYVYYVAAEDANGDDLTFSATLLPGWLNFDPSAGILHGTPDRDDVGDHNVTLSVSDGNLTTDQTFTITVEIRSGVGITDLHSPDFMLIYPNPTTGRFIVEMAIELEQELHLEILDPLGRIVIQKQYPPYYWIREEFNMSDRPAGLYFIRFYHESDQAIRKLIIQ